MRALWATLRRDALEWSSYRSAILSRGFALLSFLFSSYFVARTFAGSEPEILRQQGGYFAFLICGIAVADMSAALMNGPGQRLRRAQLDGTLEAVYLLRGGLKLFALEGLALSLATALRVLLYLFLALWMGLEPQVKHPLAGLLSLLLSLMALWPIGMLGAALTLLLKRSDPLGQILFSASLLASGVAYPTAVLPLWVQSLGEWLPPTHVLRAVRGVFLRGEGLAEIGSALWILGAFALLGGFLAIWGCRLADRWARRLGSLGHY